MIGRVCRCEVSTPWHNARGTLMLMRFYQSRYSIGGTVCGQIFDWEVFHFSQIVGSFDLLLIWLLVPDVTAARVIPVTGGGMVLRLRRSNRAIKWRWNISVRAYRLALGQTSICMYRLALTACPGLYHAWTWLHQLYSPWVPLVFSLVRKHSLVS